MIGSVSSSYSNLFPPRLAELNRNLPSDGTASSTAAANSMTPRGVSLATEVPGLYSVTPTSPSTSISPTGGASFGDVLSQAVHGVNNTMQNAEVQKARVMSGETNNLHQAMLSMQEANVAFSLMTEVRNKLVESYQEVMRMQV